MRAKLSQYIGQTNFAVTQAVLNIFNFSFFNKKLNYFIFKYYLEMLYT
jgi:hypothetical protein